MYTNINAPSYLGTCSIGAYCAIAGRLVVRSSNHNTGFLNMNVAMQHRVVRSAVKVAGVSEKPVNIGHGVWIGDSVIILPNVSVGNGAVIGAGSVVTKDIPDYAIAVGNPCRVIKYRFSPDVLELLAPVEWWNWPLAKIRANRFLFEQDLSKMSLDEVRMLLESIA
jgi:acetyltransferase-like isoleucine patch superfamily enzyme